MDPIVGLDGDVGASVTALDAAEERRLRRQVARLRFADPLEARFRRDYEGESGPDRLALVTVAAVAIGLAPLYERLWLHAPAGFVATACWLQFGLELPALLLVALCGLPRLRRWQPGAVVLAALAVAGGLVGQRVVGDQYGFWVPPQFATLTVAAVFAMGRLRFRLFAPWAALILGGAWLVEWGLLGNGLRARYEGIALVIGGLVVGVGGYTLERAAREAWLRRQQLVFLALHDPLTGLPNRRYFDQYLTGALAAARAARQPVALLLLDVDHFKAFNDHYGHPAGDACLRRIGAWLRQHARDAGPDPGPNLGPDPGPEPGPHPACFCARLGGEEFAVLWTGSAAEAAPARAERLRRGVGALGISHAGVPRPEAVVTASGGLVEFVPPPANGALAEPAGQATRLVASADALLYEAKRAGRDRLVAA